MATLLILGEDVAHGALVGELVRRTLLAQAEAQGADWIDEGHLDGQLEWQGEEALAEVRPGLRYTKSSAAGKKLKLRGWGARSAGDQFWRSVLAWADLGGAEGLIVATDGGDGLAEALLQAARDRAAAPPMAPGCATAPLVLAIIWPEAEGWFVLGFEPTHRAEGARHEALVRALGFDPLLAPHRLSSRPSDAPTDAKRVLNQLVYGENTSRAVGRDQVGDLVGRCLPSAERIARSGQACGIQAFVAAIEGELARLFGLKPEAP